MYSQGALLAVVGTTSAAMLAFQLSRKLGKKMAEKAAAEEMSEEQRQSGLFTRVQNAIESGSVQQQVVAVTLLRLTPVIPFRSANPSQSPSQSFYESRQHLTCLACGQAKAYFHLEEASCRIKAEASCCPCSNFDFIN